jgi:purine-nucleoside phosphorylase
VRRRGKERRAGEGDRVVAAAAAVRHAGVTRRRAAIVLGSGLSSFTEGIRDTIEIPYADVPGMPETAVSGHAGAIYAGALGGSDVLVFSGRVHHYEGRPPDEVTFTVRLVAELEVPILLLTNAAGGIDPGFEVGDLMAVADQISLVAGPRRLTGRPFVMAGAYSERLRRLARTSALSLGIRLREGVYLGSLGPAYETPAEVRMARLIGASAVGMSTVTEAQAAVSRGLEVAGLSLITNIPLPGRFDETTHAEVLAAGREGARRLVSLVSEVVERL